MTDVPSVASTIAKAAIVILVMFSYPLQVHPCRASVDAVLKWRPNTKGSISPPNSSPSRTVPLLSGGTTQPAARNDTIGEVRFAIITTCIIIFSYTAAMTISSLDKVLAYVGSTGSTSISFILPGLFYYKISAPDSAHHQRLAKEDDDESGDEEEGGNSGSSWFGTSQWRQNMLRKLSLALAIYGFVVMVLCLGTNLFFGGSGH
jgi:amino acid permease